ncbi:MAG TPA: hypothetical protein VNC11_05710 [Gemmatimonadaceae bacterium]|jgi:hypothetical protein|nr:hypothetical protein [Gemmatimonadaceae bacterium]
MMSAEVTAAALDTVLKPLYTTALMADSNAGEHSTSNGFFSGRRRSIGLWVAAFATIVAGFADLAAGGTTIAPILLVLGYCVLVPIAILK